jgi:very-short-patch-repair endonuclease
MSKRKNPESERVVAGHIKALGWPDGTETRYQAHGTEMDFAWPDVKVALDADGLIHFMGPGVKRTLRDRARDHRLREQGWTVVRVRTMWRNEIRLRAEVEGALALVHRLRTVAA